MLPAGLDQVDRGQVVPADAGLHLRRVVVAGQLVGRGRRVDAPSRHRVPHVRHRLKLSTGVDIAVVDIDQGGRDQRSDGRIPLRMPTDGPVGRLLAARHSRQRCIRRRRVAQREFVGDQIVGQLGGVGGQLRLHTARHTGRFGEGRRDGRGRGLGAADDREHDHRDGEWPMFTLHRVLDSCGCLPRSESFASDGWTSMIVQAGQADGRSVAGVRPVARARAT